MWVLLGERRLALLLTTFPPRWAHVLHRGAFSKGIHSAHAPTQLRPSLSEQSRALTAEYWGWLAWGDTPTSTPERRTL